MKKRIVCLLSVFYCVFALAKPVQCRIDVEISNLGNKKIILATEYGVKDIVIDTVTLDSLGRGYYESKTRLSGGIYVILLPTQKYFEFLINDEQFFTITTDTTDIIGHLKIEGAEESDLFRYYQQMAGEFTAITKNNSDSIEMYKNHLKIFKDSIYTRIPGSFLSKYLKMQDDPVIPNLQLKSKEKPTSDFFKKIYNIKNQHYFDNIDFSDKRLLHTKLIGEKINYYFNVFISNDADSLCKSIDRLVALAKTDDEAYRFVLNIINLNFRATRYPTHENALVYLADNYYLNGKALWADPKFLKLFEEKVNALRPLLIGAVAPNLILHTLTDEPLILNEINNKITILYFWSPDCNKCIEETPKLNQLYEKYENKGVEVLAIYIHADKQVWKEYIISNKLDWINAYDPLMKSNFSKLYNVQFTPKLFIINSEKRIVAKDITVEKAEKVIEKLLN